MTDRPSPINTLATLANVARLQTLVVTLQNRHYGLPGMGCYYGYAGFGKSTAGIYVTNKFGACHVQALPFGGTKKLLEMIVAELGLRPSGTVASLFDQAAAEMARTDRVLIIDEADQILRDSTIEAVRSLHDQTGAPVILMGEERLPQKLRKWERVHGRMLDWVAAEPATPDDVALLTPIYAAGIQIAPDIQAALLAASNGSIRNVSTNLANLAGYAALNGLHRISMVEWGKRAFHTGVAPEARRGVGSIAPVMARGRRMAS